MVVYVHRFIVLTPNGLRYPLVGRDNADLTESSLSQRNCLKSRRLPLVRCTCQVHTLLGAFFYTSPHRKLTSLFQSKIEGRKETLSGIISSGVDSNQLKTEAAKSFMFTEIFILLASLSFIK
jgi:hypothetical protein